MSASPSPVAPTIDATGISAPAFSDILEYLTEQYLAIYGADAYLGNDSQDGQFLGIVTRAIADCNAACVAVYNAFSPATAQGNGLASVVKINGLKKLVASFSTMPCELVAVADTPITNGQVRDGNGNYWTLPASVTIPTGGSVTVTATCTTQGAISASAGAVSIATPTFGWQSATFTGTVTAGAPVETDAALRVRQGDSVALPSLTVFEGIVAAIKAVEGVTRVAAYENNTSSTNGDGIPANSLCFVVEGGTASAIQQAIASKIAPGIGTYGNQSTTITDSVGSTRTIAFQATTESTIDVNYTIIPGEGWASSTEPVIAAAVAAYLSALPTGQNISYFGLIAPGLLPGTAYAGTFSISGLTIAKNSGSTQSTDMTMAFDEAPVGSAAHVNFTIA